MYILSKIVQAVNPALEKFKSGVKNHSKDIFLGFCIVLISIIGYNLGRLNALNKTPAKTDENANIYQTPTGTPVPNTLKPLDTKYQIQHTDPRVVASKASSSKKYHYSWCASGKRIAQKNQLWFDNEEIAIKAGYTLAGNCSK